MSGGGRWDAGGRTGASGGGAAQAREARAGPLWARAGRARGTAAPSACPRELPCRRALVRGTLSLMPQAPAPSGFLPTMPSALPARPLPAVGGRERRCFLPARRRCPAAAERSVFREKWISHSPQRQGRDSDPGLCFPRPGFRARPPPRPGAADVTLSDAVLSERLEIGSLTAGRGPGWGELVTEKVVPSERAESRGVALEPRWEPWAPSSLGPRFARL